MSSTIPHRVARFFRSGMAVLLSLVLIHMNTPVHSMGTHILHAGPSCLIQPVRTSLAPRGDHLLKQHRGTCYSSLLCKQKGGVAIGKCGLGNACCIFPQSCNSISVRNLTYFTNVDYPAPTMMNRSTPDCSLTIHRMPGIHPICKLRLDFIEYDVEGHKAATTTTAASTVASTVPVVNEANGVAEENQNVIDDNNYEDDDDCGNDRISLRAMHTEEDIVPPICARKIGHHVTIDVRKHIGPFILTVHSSRSGKHSQHRKQTTRRRWNILINQIECHRSHGSGAGGTMALINRNRSSS